MSLKKIPLTWNISKKTEENSYLFWCIEQLQIPRRTSSQLGKGFDADPTLILN